MVKHLATITAAGALALAAAVPAGASAPGDQRGCEEFGGYALALTGFELGEQAVEQRGSAAHFVRPSVRSHGMVLCMTVNYNAGVAYARGSRGWSLPYVGKPQAYVGAAYLAGLAQH
jgi:hypothetical protein